MPIIPTTWKAEARRSQVEANLSNIERLYLKKNSNNVNQMEM
jgi:hypothetical protein